MSTFFFLFFGITECQGEEDTLGLGCKERKSYAITGLAVMIELTCC